MRASDGIFMLLPLVRVPDRAELTTDQARKQLPVMLDLKCPDGESIWGHSGLTPVPWRRHQMETFSALLAFCAGIHRWPVNSPHRGQWRGALMFSLICAWIYGWRHHAHYDVTVMWWIYIADITHVSCTYVNALSIYLALIVSVSLKSAPCCALVLYAINVILDRVISNLLKNKFQGLDGLNYV